MEKLKAKILYAEDDVYLSFVTKDNLEKNGYQITLCRNGVEALSAFGQSNFDLCILDVMMPEMDGFTLTKKIREKNQNIPILFLSAKSLKEDRIAGLMTGGDDFLTKPFSIEELILKIEVFLRRSKISDQYQLKRGQVKIGEFIFDPLNLILTIKEDSQRLTSREAELLKYFAENRNKVLKKEDILHEVWDTDGYFNSRSLDVFVSRLRKYLAKDSTIRINNIHGIGFIMVTGS
jgi:DNA-binding response OmpR family regulator